MPDLSGTLGRELEAATARAKKLTEAGDTAGARKAYLRASTLALSYARSAPTSTIKKQRLERAKALRARAFALSLGRHEASSDVIRSAR